MKKKYKSVYGISENRPGSATGRGGLLRFRNVKTVRVGPISRYEDMGTYVKVKESGQRRLYSTDVYFQKKSEAQSFAKILKKKRKASIYV